jgi:hypothetical protein
LIFNCDAVRARASVLAFGQLGGLIDSSGAGSDKHLGQNDIPRFAAHRRHLKMRSCLGISGSLCTRPTTFLSETTMFAPSQLQAAGHTCSRRPLFSSLQSCHHRTFLPHRNSYSNNRAVYSLVFYVRIAIDRKRHILRYFRGITIFCIYLDTFDASTCFYSHLHDIRQRFAARSQQLVLTARKSCRRSGYFPETLIISRIKRFRRYKSSGGRYLYRDLTSAIAFDMQLCIFNNSPVSLYESIKIWCTKLQYPVESANYVSKRPLC